MRSPGRIEGTILVPKTRRRTRPKTRTTAVRSFAVSSSGGLAFAKCRTYEAFLLNRQRPSEENTFPHARAETSNTFSSRKEGALYGFFRIAAPSRAFPVSLLSVPKLVPPTTISSIVMVDHHSGLIKIRRFRWCRTALGTQKSCRRVWQRPHHESTYINGPA
jgi:hypothetical protein